MDVPVLPGAEAWSHTAAADGAAGVLVLHGLTGTPATVRGLGEALAGGGFHVEVPRLPGHGTSEDELQTMRWADWTAEVEKVYTTLAGRASAVVVAGLSMGGALALWCALQHPEVAGLVCINPATRPPADEIQAMVRQFAADGMAVIPGGGNDIADPDAHEIGYADTPIRPLLSLIDDGLAPLSRRYGELDRPLLLFTSRQDHVIEPAQSEYLAARCAGPVDHRWLERSYHVATLDFDRDVMSLGAVEFVGKVTAEP
jgi:carboxylesterase